MTYERDKGTPSPKGEGRGEGEAHSMTQRRNLYARTPSESFRPSEGLDAKAWRTIWVVMLAPFMTQMDSTVVNVSLSSIRDDLHASISSTQWIISGYLLALALMLPLNGWLVDRFGAKRLYLFCFSAFTLASVLCGAAHTMPALIASRVLQGIAGGLLVPLTQLMMARIAGKHMAKVMGYAAIPVLLAPLLGPPLAGAILKYAGWPWLFYVNLPVGIIAVILAATILPHEDSLLQKRQFDLPGFLMLSPGLSCFLYGIEEVSHRRGYSFFVVGICLLCSFAWRALQKKDDALIDLDLFKIRDFSAATITQFLSNGIMYAGQFLVPLYLISGAGLSPSSAGWALTSAGIGMMCVYPMAGHLVEKFGCRAVSSAGVLVNFLGTLPFLWMAESGFSMPLALAGLFIRGMGQGATGIPSVAAAYASVPRSKLSFAATSTNIVQRLGGPIATTILAVVVSLADQNSFRVNAHRFFAPFVALLLFQFLVFGSARRLPVRIPSQSNV